MTGPTPSTPGGDTPRGGTPTPSTPSTPGSSTPGSSTPGSSTPDDAPGGNGTVPTGDPAPGAGSSPDATSSGSGLSPTVSSDPTLGAPEPPLDPHAMAQRMRAALAVRHRPPAHSAQVFASDLTVGDLVLLDEVGYQPVDLVSGAGSASWNPQMASSQQGCDAWAWALTAAISSARSAVDRELRTRAADGVVAMQLHLERHPGNLLTCTMLGTAIRAQDPDASPGRATHTEVPRRGARHGHSSRAAHHGTAGPFNTTLSARDFHLLVRAGYHPAGITVGAAVVGFASRSVAQGMGLSRDNMELSDQTGALYAAREQAMSRMDAEAKAVDADGVVAVTFSERPSHSMLVHAVEILVVGTALRRGDDGHQSLHPALQLSLDDPDPNVFLRG